MPVVRTGVQRHPPLTECPPARNGLTFPSYWYRLPGITDFFICTKCFSEKLAQTRFADDFESFFDYPLPGTNSSCDFNSTRVDRILARAALSGSLHELRNFAQRRAQIPICYGVNGVLGGQGVVWYSSPENPQFVACEACYEDFLVGTTFAPKFRPESRPHLANEVWACDIAPPFVKRTLHESVRNGNWQAFMDAVKHYFSAPICETKPVSSSSRKWFRPSWPRLIPQIMFCDRCFLDNVGSLPAASYFSQYHVPPLQANDLFQCTSQIRGVWSCNFYVLRTDYERWHQLISQIALKPSCDNSSSITNGEWYTIPDPANPAKNIPDVDICSSCYLGMIESTGHGNALRRLSYPPGTARVCDFSINSSRHASYIDKLAEALYINHLGPLIIYALRISLLPLCSKSTSLNITKWWGNDEFFFCAACFEEAGVGTHFASDFKYKGTVYAGQAHCDMYTTNMRQRYLRACQSQSLDEFVAYCRQRNEIHDKYAQAIVNSKVESLYTNVMQAYTNVVSGTVTPAKLSLQSAELAWKAVE